MSVRWKLRSVAESRRVEGVCWRCALRTSRHSSTAPSRADEGSGVGEAFARQRFHDVSYPLFPGSWRPPARRQFADNVVDNAGYSKVLAHEVGDKHDLSQQDRSPIVDISEEGVRTRSPRSKASNNAKKPNDLGNEVDRTNPGFGEKEQIQNIRKNTSISSENELQKGCSKSPEPLPRILRYLSSSATPKSSQSTEQQRPGSSLQARRPVSDDTPSVIGEVRLNKIDDTSELLHRKHRRRRAVKSPRNTLRDYIKLDTGLQYANHEAAQHFMDMSTSTNVRLVRRIRQGKNPTNLPESGALTIQTLKKYEQASHQLEYFKYVKVSENNKALIRKHFSRHDSINVAKRDGNSLQRTQKTARPVVENLTIGEASRFRKLIGPGVKDRSDATAERSPVTWRRIQLETEERPGEPNKRLPRSPPRDRLTRKTSVFQIGSIIRRVAQKEDSPSNVHDTEDELDLLLEKLSQSPKPYLAQAATLPQSFSRAPPSTFAGQSQHRPRIDKGFKARAEARGTKGAHFCYPRFATTVSNQSSDMDYSNSSSAMSSRRSGNGNAKITIREHLKWWRATQGENTRSSWTSHADTQNWAGGVLNTITQSGGDDEDLTGSTPNEDLEIERQMRTSSEDSVLEMINPSVHLRRGDLVELNAGHGSIVGVYVNEVQNKALIYTERGTWYQVGTKSIIFSVPHILNPHDVSGLLPYLPPQAADLRMSSEQASISNVPRNVGFPVIERLTNFLRASDAIYRKYADRLNRAYDILSESDSEGQLSVSLGDAALRILEKSSLSDLTPPMLLVIHRTLESHPHIIRPGLLHRMTPTFVILPRTTLARVNTVRDWVRAYQDDMVLKMTKPSIGDAKRSHKESVNPIATFAAKARRVIAFSRQHRSLSPVGSIGPSSTAVTLDEPNSTKLEALREHQEHFNHDEQHILKFLDVWAASSLTNQTSSLHSLGPVILRAVGMYPHLDLGRAIGFTLLQELGVVKPWDPLPLFRNKLGLPDNDPNHPATVLRNQAYDSVSCLPVLLCDSMAGFRKDWGNLTVFCIDSEETVVRDDGISLELVDGEPSLCWVHIHIANPSAFLSKDSPVARYARHATASVYFPDRVYPMMDTRLSQNHFSLANGRPCITFSAKISPDGDVIEKQITHGVLNDVRHVSLQQVKQAWASNDDVAPEADSVSLLQVGREMSSEKPFESPLMDSPAMGDLNDSDINTLRHLHRVSTALAQRRQRAGAVRYGDFDRLRLQGYISPRVHIPAAENQTALVRDDQSRCILGDAAISIDHSYRAVGQVKDMVADFMILAGEICAIWCSERNLPVPYRGIIRNPDPDPSPEVYRQSVLEPAIASRGYADLQTWRKYMGLVGVFYASCGPLEHVALGLPAYCKITSPLRRYGDLFAHWQIEAAIRHEHATGESLVGSAAARYDEAGILPFSRQEVEGEARRVCDQESRIKAASSEVSSHWMTQAIHRAFYFQEAPLPPVLEFVVRSVSDRAYSNTWGLVSAWDKPAVMHTAEASDREGGYRMNDRWEAKIVKVLPYFGLLRLHPVRLIRREEGV